MIVGVPDRFSPLGRVVDFGVGLPGCDGVDDLPVGENVTVPMEMRREIGAFTDREPTMNPNPASSKAVRLVAESMPASAATTIGVSVRSWRAAKAVMTGTNVVVSAVLPSKQPICKGNPVRSTSRPTTI